MAPRLLLAVAAAALLLPAFTAPLAAGVDRSAALAGTTVSSGAEPSILVDRVTGAIVIGDVLGVHVSHNGGATWATVTPTFIPGMVLGNGIADGWALAQDAAGRVYASTTDGPFVNVASTMDDGATWTFATAMIVTADGISDRPWLASDAAGHVAVIDNGLQGENCAYSTDAGLTFTKRATSFGPTNAGSVSATSVGTLYYAVGGHIERWLSPCTGLTGKTIPAQGAQILTQMGVDDAGRLYVAQPTTTNGAIQLIGYSSFGASTPKTLTVSSASLQSNTFASIHVQGDDVAVAWYGSTSAGDPSATSFSGVWNVYVAQIHGFWNATPAMTVTQLTTAGNHAGYFCMGGTGCGVSNGQDDPRDMLDYMGVTHDAAGNVHVAYGSDDLTNNNAVVKYAFVAKA